MDFYTTLRVELSTIADSGLLLYASQRSVSAPPLAQTVALHLSARLFAGMDYDFDKHHHVFGAKVEYTLVAEKRKSKHDLTGCEGIWVGRSTTTPGVGLVIPIS